MEEERNKRSMGRGEKEEKEGYKRWLEGRETRGKEEGMRERRKERRRK